MTTELLQELARFFDIEGLSFNDEGICSLRLDDQYSLILRDDEERNRLVIVAELGTPRELSQELLMTALSYNLTRIAVSGAWIALDVETGTLFLADELSTATNEIASFFKRLEHFFQDYLACHGLCSVEAIAHLLEKEDQGGDIAAHISQMS